MLLSIILFFAAWVLFERGNVIMGLAVLYVCFFR